MVTMALPLLSESLQIISKTLVLLVIFTMATMVLPCQLELLHIISKTMDGIAAKFYDGYHDIITIMET